jgi:hypothetical protein
MMLIRPFFNGSGSPDPDIFRRQAHCRRNPQH